MKLVDYLKKTLNREQFETMVLRYVASDVWEIICITEYCNDYSDYRLMDVHSGKEIALRIAFSEDGCCFPPDTQNGMYAIKDTDTLLLIAYHLWNEKIIPESLNAVSDKIKSNYSHELEKLDKSVLFDFRRTLTDEANKAYETLKENNMHFFADAKEKATDLLVKSGLINIRSDWKQKTGSMHSVILLSVGKKVYMTWVSTTRDIVMQSEKYTWSDNIAPDLTSDELAKRIHNTIFSWYGGMKSSDEKQGG